MKLNFVITVFIVGLVSSTNVIAQKIGYANIDLILAYMPETKQMNQVIATYEKKLGQQLQAKQQYYQTKGQEYLALANSDPNSAKIEPMQKELAKLEAEIKKDTEEAQRKLIVKRQDLLMPITQKLQKEIDAISKDEEYEYIFNTVDGSGVSIILSGPDKHDLTKKIMTRLGIEIPEE